MATIAKVSANPFDTPLHSPFVTSQASSTAARAVAVTLELEGGAVAHGEAVPVRYVTGETIESVVETVARVGPALAGIDALRYGQAFEIIARLAPDSPSARCGLEMAVLDAWSQATGVPLWRLWGSAAEAVETDVTIPIVPNAGELAEIAWAFGIRVFKMKVGGASIEEDHARVRAVRQAAPEARLRIDANQAFTPDAAVAFVEQVVAEGAHVELLEQPVRKEDYDGLAEVAARSPVPVFADESCRTPADAVRLATTSPVHGLNLKINKCGIAGVLEIISIARATGRRLMLGCMLETRRSIGVALALACGTGAFEFLDLDAHMLLNEPGENCFFRQDGARMGVNGVNE